MSPNIAERRTSFEVDGVQIPAALTMPENEMGEGKGKCQGQCQVQGQGQGQGQAEWCLVLVPGSFFNDLDGNYKSPPNPFQASPHAYADLARQIARQGHAVFRYARSNLIIRDEGLAAAHRRFDERIAVVAEACKAARMMAPEATRLAVAGHSEGSVVALRLLSERRDINVDAYISLSGPGSRFFDIMIEQVEASAKDGSFSFGDMKVPFQLYKRSIELVRSGEPVPEEITKALPPFGVHTMDDTSRQYLRDYDAAMPATLIAQAACPVLIVQGGQDTSVLPDNAEILFHARRESRASTAVAYFPELQHYYKVAPPGISPMDSFAIDNESDERVSRSISAWLYSLESGS